MTSPASARPHGTETAMPWFTCEWLACLTRAVTRLQVSPEDLAAMMVLYQTVPEIDAHMRAHWRDPIAGPPVYRLPADAPPEVVAAWTHLVEFNEWVLLSIALKPDAELPTGAEPTLRLREAWERASGDFVFRPSPGSARG